FSYDAATGVMTYTGPSAAEARAHFSGGTGVTITDGAVAIGQAVGTTDNVQFGTVSANVVGNVTGNLTGNVTGDVSGNAGTVTNGVYTTSSVTALSDVTDAGSGAIITDAERTKLDGIEAGATGDQTGAEIKLAYEAEAKAFTDAQFDKLAAIEAGATGDQTGAEIKLAYEAEAKAFTDAQFDKLAAIADNATANQTDAYLLARANHTGTQTAATISDFDAEVANNAAVTANTAKVSADGLVTTHSDVTDAGSGAIITDAERTKLDGIETAATADQTGAEIKLAYEAEAKAFTDAQFDKLAAIADNATANQTDAYLLARANHTGTQTAATISDFDAEVANNAAVTANTAKVSADGLVTTHSDVTDAGSGAIITDAERTKLDGIETGATGDQTGAEIKLAYEAEAKAFTDAQFDKLAAIEAAADVTDAANVAAAGAVMNTGDETIAGTKTFSSTIQGNLNGNVTGNVTGQVSDISNHDTGDLAEGSNLYYTDARSRLAMSATDAGGDGSFSYDNTTGVMTYTGPSAAETRAHFSAGTGVTITDGAVAIGQAVGTTDDVSFASATTTGNADFGGTLDATGATTLGSTLNVTGNTELDGTLGADGNLRVGSNGASKFTVDASSGAITTLGDIAATSGGILANSLQITGTTTLMSASVETLSISGTATVGTPSLGIQIANKSYVDGQIDTHAHSMPEAYSYLSSGTYTGLGADVSGTAVTITVTGANLAAGTYKLHLDGNEATMTATVVDANTVTFSLLNTDVSGMTSRTGLLAPQLSIDGIATGLNIFVNL
ncbi:MAG: beta strand repeat-containing protein, partial [Flavobacteriales bacterium]